MKLKLSFKLCEITCSIPLSPGIPCHPLWCCWDPLQLPEKMEQLASHVPKHTMKQLPLGTKSVCVCASRKCRQRNRQRQSGAWTEAHTLLGCYNTVTPPDCTHMQRSRSTVRSHVGVCLFLLTHIFWLVSQRHTHFVL